MFKYEYKAAADQAATVSYIDEERRKAFCAGVDWAVERFRRLLAPSAYEEHKGYPKTLLDGYTLDDVRELFANGFSKEMKD